MHRPMILIDGKQISASLKESIKEQVTSLPEKYGRVPHLVVVRVGEDPASVVYVRNKAKACEACGIRNTTIVLPEETSESALLEKVRSLNADDSVDGILVQLPLPGHISEARVIETIAREKDVDGFHPVNVGRLVTGEPGLVPCTPFGCLRMLELAGIPIDGQRAVIIGRSNIVGKPMLHLLLGKNATVTICHSHTKDLPAITREADILVAAVGRPKFVTADMVKPGATVIDVGINRIAPKKLVGDVDFESVKEVAGAITPVPGGVGLLTVAMLMENVVRAAEMQLQA